MTKRKKLTPYQKFMAIGHYADKKIAEIAARGGQVTYEGRAEAVCGGCGKGHALFDRPWISSLEESIEAFEERGWRNVTGLGWRCPECLAK